MTINSISFRPVSGTGTDATFTSFYVDMGLCSSDQLGPMFESNYIGGTKTRVYERTSSVTFYAVEPWTAITLDTPFYYDPAMGNLIIEVGWPDGSNQFYTYNYPTAGASMVKAGYGAGTGDPYYECPNLLIEGDLAFEQTTFAAIKATFNR